MHYKHSYILQNLINLLVENHLIHSKLSRTMSLSKDYDTTVHQLFPDLIKQLENEF